MEEKKIFCSFKDHGEIIAKSYCDECKLYMCNKCDNFHSKFHQKHKSYDLNNINISEIFTGFCKEKGHLSKLNFFCKTHNSLKIKIKNFSYLFLLDNQAIIQL